MPTECEEYLKQSGVFDHHFLNPLQDPEKEIKHFELRHEFIAKYGFAIINDETIELLKGYQPILEVGAGSGYWSYELQKAGVEVIATDSFTGKYSHRKPVMRGEHWKHHYTEVEKITAKRAILKYPNRNLLTVWPDYVTPWTGAMLRFYKGKYLIYVGEGSGGCTRNDRFHKILDSEYIEIADLSIPQFDGIHDRLYVYQRKESK